MWGGVLGVAQNCGLERVDGISADGAGPPDNYSGTVRGAFTVHTRLSCVLHTAFCCGADSGVAVRTGTLAVTL
jgi:hypothetical protein